MNFWERKIHGAFKCNLTFLTWQIRSLARHKSILQQMFQPKYVKFKQSISSPTLIHRRFIYIRWNVLYHFVSREWRTLYPGFQVHFLNSPRQCKHLGQVRITKQRSFQNLHQISILSSIYNQVYNFFVCTLCPCLTSYLQWNWDKICDIPARSTWHVSRERAVLDSIALRKHNTERLFLICVRKTSISNLHVIDMPLNEQTISIFFTVQFYQSHACDSRACLLNREMQITSSFLLFVFVQHFSQSGIDLSA